MPLGPSDHSHDCHKDSQDSEDQQWSRLWLTTRREYKLKSTKGKLLGWNHGRIMFSFHWHPFNGVHRDRLNSSRHCETAHAKWCQRWEFTWALVFTEFWGGQSCRHAALAWLALVTQTAVFSLPRTKIRFTYIKQGSSL
jgi:hypothetical protein